MALYPNIAVKKGGDYSNEYEYEAKTIIFIVDISESMAGEKLDITKTALRAALAFLYNPADERISVYFNIVTFSFGFELLFAEPAPLNQTNFEKGIIFYSILFSIFIFLPTFFPFPRGVIIYLI